LAPFSMNLPWPSASSSRSIQNTLILGLEALI
jgi:hypothetical protein